MVKKVLLVVDAPGPAEFIEPVIPLLKKARIVLKILTVRKPPTEILKEFKPTRCDTESQAERIYKKFNPDVLLTAMSSLMLGPYVIERLTRIAHAEKRKIICFQDYWANHRQPQNFAVKNYWDVVIAPDKLAKEYLEEDRLRAKIVVTGNPSFERFKKINVLKERLRLREEFHIPEGKHVIFYAGQGTPQSAGADNKTFSFFAKTLRKLVEPHGFVLIAHPHPRDEYPRRYHELAPDLPYVKIPRGISDYLLPVADVIVSMYSTSLIHACYLRIPAISILLNDAGKRRLRIVSLGDFPPNKVGASLGIYRESIEEFGHGLERIFHDRGYRLRMEKTQKENFVFQKSSAAEAVKKAILREI